MNLKKLRNYTFLFSFIFGIQSISFSQIEECGFQFTSENQDYYNSIKKEVKKLEAQFFAKRNSTILNSVPIKAHIVRTSSGSGGLTELELNDALAVMNSIYIDAGIEFFLCDGINYIDNDDYYDFQSTEENGLTSPNNLNGVINIYFTDSITNNSGGGLCGYAYFPGGPETILMANSCATNGSTLSHEMGHFFALAHTHGNSNVAGSTAELVNGSNCDNTGDFICDTPADPQLGFANVNTLCVYNGSAIDSNSELYAPDPNNLMSYSRKQCRNFFSVQQYARINAISYISRSNLTCSSFNADFAADETDSCASNFTVNFTDNSVGATSWAWDVDGDDITDYTIQNPTHTYNTSGGYDVALSISDGYTTINKVKSQYINVGALEVSTATIALSLTLDDSADETSWQFLDSNNNVLYSGGPYTGFFDANTTRTETFIINPNECYSFEINDSAGNGICCSYGNGFYELRADDNSLLASGADFQTSKTDNFYSGVLSIQDFSTEFVQLFPNPSSSVITIKSQSLPNSYSLYNTLGQVLKQSQVKSDVDLNINIESLSEGMYFIKLTKDNSSQVLSFIKN